MAPNTDAMTEALRDEIATVAPYANTDETGEYTGDVHAGASE